MNNELFLSINKPASTNYYIGNGVKGSYDGKVLTPGGVSKWRKQPNNVPLNTQSQFIPQGNQIPLAFESNAVQLPADSMFYFANNLVSMDCCPSTYTTDRGCVCTTEQQRKFIGEQRGNNKNFSEYPTI